MAENTVTDESKKQNLLTSRKDILLSEYKLTNLYSSVFGLYVFPTIEDIGEWHGFLVVREGIYEGARIKFIINYPLDFPQNGPKIKILTKIWHPLISDDDGELDLKVLIPVWNYGEKCQILDMLMKFKNIFRELSYITNTDSLNPEAAIMYIKPLMQPRFNEEPDNFLKKVSEDCKASEEDFDNHYENCPYKHKRRDMPKKVKEILENPELSNDEKKEMIINAVKNMNAIFGK